VLIGRNAVSGGRSDTVPTDPFMMLIAPEERFDDDAAFPVASFCEIQNGVQVSVVDDFVYSVDCSSETGKLLILILLILC